MMKKMKVWFAVCCFALFCAIIGVTAKAEGEAEGQPAYIDIAADGSWVSGDCDAEMKYYSFSLPSAGRAEVAFQSYAKNGLCILYDADMEVEFGSKSCSGTSKSPSTGSITKDLEAGGYCVKICRKGEEDWDGPYRLKISFTPANNDETEPNNSFETATPISGSDVTVTGFLSETDEYDFYKFEIADAGKVEVTWDKKIKRGAECSLWDADRILLKEIGNDKQTMSYPDGKPGIYYIKVTKGKKFLLYDSLDYTGTYTLKYQVEPQNGPADPVTPEPDVPDPGKTAKLSVDTTEISASVSGELSTPSVYVDSGDESFTATSDSSSWLKVGKSAIPLLSSSKASFTKSGTLYIFAEKNTGAESRTGKITLTHQNGTLKKEITVKQDGLTLVLKVDADEKTADKRGKFYDNKVNVITQKTGGFTVEVKDSSWLRVSSQDTDDVTKAMSKLSFKEDGDFYLVAMENTEKEERVAEVVVSHELGELSKTVKVTQKGTEKYLTVEGETAPFDDSAAAFSGAFQIYASEDVKWTVKTKEKWIKFSKSDSADSKNEKYDSLEGKGDATFYIYVKSNGTFKKRGGWVTVSAPGLEEHKIYVSQVEKERDIPSLLKELVVTVSRETFNVGKTSKIKFIFPEGLYPSDVANVKYASNKKKVATVNKDGVITAKRKGKATITVKVTLDTGDAKTFKLRVTIGKRKVKIVEK